MSVSPDCFFKSHNSVAICLSFCHIFRITKEDDPWQKTELTLLRRQPDQKDYDDLIQKTMTTWPKKWWLPNPKNEDHLTNKLIQPYPKIKTTWIKKWKRPDPKNEDNLTQKWRHPDPINDDNLTQNIKTTWPKNQDNTTQKWGWPEPKNWSNLTQKMQMIDPKNED